MPRGFTLTSSKFHEKPSKDSVLVLSGANLFRYGLKDGPTRKPNRYVHKNNEQLSKEFFGKERIVYQNVASSIPRMIATLECNDRPADDTVNNLVLNNSELLKPVLLVLNSNLITFYLKYAVINCSTLTVHLDEPYVGQFPIKDNINSEILKIICDYLLILNHHLYYLSRSQKNTSDIINSILFFNKIANYLIYESYLQNQLGNQLTNHLYKLEQIDSEKIICTKKKEDLAVSVSKEALEKISKIHVRLKTDSIFNQIFEKIDENKWVKFFEALRIPKSQLIKNLKTLGGDFFTL